MQIDQLKTSKKMPILLFFCYFIILFLVYSRYYLTDQFPMSGDAINFITELSHAANVIKGGEFPLWNKWLAGGVTFLPSITPTFLLAILPVREAIYLLYVGILALGATCFALYLMEIKCSVYSAVGIGLCYLLSVHLGGARKSHTFIILAVAMCPVILYLIERYFNTGKLKWLLFSSVAMAVQFYIGMLQTTFYFDLFLFVYLLAFGFHHRMKIKTMLLHGMAWGFSYLGLISLKLIPMLEQNMFFDQSGAADSGYEYFTSYSISPIKLIMMFFPKFFGADNLNQPLGMMYSSELDIELFLGSTVVLLVIVGIIRHIRAFRVQFMAVCMGLVFLYAALGSFPLIGKILYHVPILSNFRVPSRALFLFVFLAYTIAAIALSDFQEKEERSRTIALFSKVGFWILSISVGMIVTAVMVVGVLDGFTIETLRPMAEYAKVALLPEIVCLVVVLFVVYLISSHPKQLKHAMQPVLCGFMVVVAVLQTLPYTSLTEPCPVSFLETSDETSEQLKQEIGNYKIWDAFAGIDGVHSSIISLNRGMSKQMASINAYITFNNPNLYRLFTQEENAQMNSSGLLTGSMKAEQNVYYQNSLLSMLGVKYLIDSSGILAKGLPVVQVNGNDGVVEYQAEQIVLPNTQGEVSVIQQPFTPVAQSAYEISFQCNSEQAMDFYVDFYGGSEYDNAAQQVDFSIQEGQHSYTGLVMSENSNLYSEIYLRIVSTLNAELSLENFTVKRLDVETFEGVYTPWEHESDPQIYVNQNARDVLYVPDAIEQIEDEDILYRDTILFDLDSVNYMENQSNRQLSPEQTNIRNIDFRNNSITATIDSAEDTFVNFSQCYYPGWKAYVDGKSVELYMVNGLIMGMEVPAGTHVIQFSYEPVTFVVGGLLTGGTIVLLLLAYINREKGFMKKLLMKRKG